MARYDFGLSEKDFWEITPKMFLALGKRRVIGQRYERYAHALTASAVYNTSRTKQDDPMVEPFDFVMTDEQSDAKARKARFTVFVKKAIGSMPMSTSMEKLLEVRSKVIKDLGVAGCEEPEKFFDSIWPHLKPKE